MVVVCKAVRRYTGRLVRFIIEALLHSEFIKRLHLFADGFSKSKLVELDKVIEEKIQVANAIYSPKSLNFPDPNRRFGGENIL